ncbi:MAG: type II toxin-antitoxin system VapC family toxin [Bryobacterales bacterium]|nr:type II toxin-antitoxin system VapC family toxin [Bryobacterales bacterium]
MSVIAYWEVMVKAMKGTLDVGDPRQWWGETLEALGLRPLLYRPEHIAVIYHLPPVHQDPFDRALIAQAMVEGLALVTASSRGTRARDCG